MATVDTAIPNEMQAVQCNGIRDYRVHTLPTRPNGSLGQHELLVKVTRCGLCAGDAKCYTGAPMFWGDADRPAYVETPVTPGHEFVGVVVEMGEGAGEKHKVSLGSQVTCEQVLACGTCLYCRMGKRWLCAPHDIFGFHKRSQGGCAEYMVFPENAIVYEIPSSLPPEIAVYVEPLSCSVHGVERGDIQLGDTVVVSGCGPIGLGMIAAAKMRSPARLIALDCSEHRLELARLCGAEVVLNPLRENVVRQIQDMTDGYGCDVYLEASGNPVSVRQGLLACRKAANFVEFSVFKEETTVDWTLIGDTKSLNIFGAHCSGANGYRHAIDMLSSGLLPMDRIVTHSLHLNEMTQGLEMVDTGAKAASVKVTVDPTL